MIFQNGYTPFLLACLKGHPRIAVFLISSGANKKALNKVLI